MENWKVILILLAAVIVITLIVVVLTYWMRKDLEKTNKIYQECLKRANKARTLDEIKEVKEFILKSAFMQNHKDLDSYYFRHASSYREKFINLICELNGRQIQLLRNTDTVYDKNQVLLMMQKYGDYVSNHVSSSPNPYMSSSEYFLLLSK